jgi:predicted phage baseplate assembly protein
MVLADHGCRIESETHPGPDKPAYKSQARAHRIRLKEGPLSFRIEPDDKSPVSQILDADPHLAKPQIVKLKVASQDWGPVMPSLMNSGPFDPHFVVETDNEGCAWIRFGDGEYGMPPSNAGSEKPDGDINVTYRVGVGRSGNVGPKSLVHVIEPANCKDFPGISSLQNPLPAWGGIDAESMEKVQQIAPAAFHAEQLRAVTEEDYARAAERHPEVSNAVATFRWTGSWHTVFITIDPVGGTELTLELKQRVRDWVARFTQAGYDLEIDEPDFVPLEIEVDVCVAPDHFRGDVEEALLLALDNQQQPDGMMGFFHPDRYTFGQALYLSELYAAIEAVDGVESAMVRVFQRYGKPSKNPLNSGRISMGRLEIVRMDNDPNFPEDGILILNMLGGK